jgi:hypothetical protein
MNGLKKKMNSSIEKGCFEAIEVASSNSLGVKHESFV